MTTDWKVGDKVVVKDPNFPAMNGTVTKVGRKLVRVGRQSFRLDTYPCRSTGKYNDKLLYLRKDWEFLQIKHRIETALISAPAHLRITRDSDSFFKVLREKLDNIESEARAWHAYICTEGKI